MSFNVLITGSNGYVGSALVEHLSSCDFINKVVGYDSINGDDILDQQRLVETLTDHKINLVIHLAAMSSVASCNEDPLKANIVNVDGTKKILNAMKITDCLHIIYASTSSVYGNLNTVPYTEEMETKPCSSYGISKLLGEKVIRDYYNNHEGSYLIFRMFNVVGTSGISTLDHKINSGYDRLFSALQEGQVVIYGNNYATDDGTCERDYISLKDVCNAYILGAKLIYNQVKVKEVINISSQVPLSVQSIISKWNEISKEVPLKPVTYTYGLRRSGDPAKVFGSNQKAFNILGWYPKMKIDNIIIDFYTDKSSNV